MVDRNELLMKNINVVYSVVHKKFPSLLGDEDFLATAMLAGVEAVNSWDESKGQLAPHIFKQVEYALYKELAKRRDYKGVLSLEDKVSNMENALSYKDVIPSP